MSDKKAPQQELAQKIHHAASSPRNLMITAAADCRSMNIGNNHLRSFSLRAVKRSTHLLEQRAVRQE
jgi:hypothetical protein